MLRSSAVAAAVLLVAGVTNAYATVGGQTYIIDIKASRAGEIKARMEFIDDGLGPGDAGTVGVDIEDAGDYTGNYTTTPPATFMTSYQVVAQAPDDGFFSKFSGMAIDLKQIPVAPLATLFTKLGVPGRTVGFGFSTSGDLFLFTGEELLP